MNMTCACKEFKENMLQLNGATIMASIHGHKFTEDFVYFRYCPWCGKKLVDLDIYPEKKNHDKRDIL